MEGGWRLRRPAKEGQGPRSTWDERSPTVGAEDFKKKKNQKDVVNGGEKNATHLRTLLLMTP